jgi:hypothetical protein
MEYREQFPDFDDVDNEAKELIALGFRDISWRNDACPCFIRSPLMLWFNFKEPKQREFRGGKRFEVYPLDFDEAPTGPALCATDDFKELVAWLKAISTLMNTIAIPIGKCK